MKESLDWILYEAVIRIGYFMKQSLDWILYEAVIRLDTL